MEQINRIVQSAKTKPENYEDGWGYEINMHDGQEGGFSLTIPDNLDRPWTLRVNGECIRLDGKKAQLAVIEWLKQFKVQS